MRFLSLFSCLLLIACDNTPLNDPYSKQEAVANVRYVAFSGRPKTLDPARSYTTDSSVFVAQIYEPPLQYHYLKRPYALVPLTATEVPVPLYVDAAGAPLPNDTSADEIAYSFYDIHIQPGIFYQPHPAFAKNSQGQALYYPLSPKLLATVNTLYDFPQSGTRELIAEDYIYQIKRLAHPDVQSPIFGFMSDHIVGLEDYATVLSTAQTQLIAEDPHRFLDLRDYPLAGVELVDRYTYRIKIKGKYAQFNYWLAMPFFSPMPWEADRFYSQAGLDKKNINLDWYPVGTGAYLLANSNPDREMILERNPNFRGEAYPSDGMPGDAEAGLLADAGKPMPFIDKAVFKLEVEVIPQWNKFLQGYYDVATISSDSFDQAVQVNEDGVADLSPAMRKKDIRLYRYVEPTNFFAGFNMLDPIVGTNSEKTRYLRQAISIAVDYEEYIALFYNGRGVPAQSLMPPGVFGYRSGKEGMNPVVYDWVNGAPQRKSLSIAKTLLVKAGYAQGIDPTTNAPLVLNLDVPADNSPDSKSLFAWWRKQFEKIGIQLNIRASHWNHFQQKLRNGNTQLFLLGWVADYPDPENFLFLLNGSESAVADGGQNASNYNNAMYNQLFKQMKNLPDGIARQALIDQMISISQKDAPLMWGFHPISFQLAHGWNRVSKPDAIANNTLKYLQLNPVQRASFRQQWNPAILWPLALLICLFFIMLIPVLIKFYLKERRAKERR